jgi:hypothetical protein
VAQALDCRVIRHPELEAGLRHYFGDGAQCSCTLFIFLLGSALLWT